MSSSLLATKKSVSLQFFTPFDLMYASQAHQHFQDLRAAWSHVREEQLTWAKVTVILLTTPCWSREISPVEPAVGCTTSMATCEAWRSPLESTWRRVGSLGGCVVLNDTLRVPAREGRSLESAARLNVLAGARAGRGPLQMGPPRARLSLHCRNMAVSVWEA